MRIVNYQISIVRKGKLAYRRNRYHFGCRKSLHQESLEGVPFFLLDLQISCIGESSSRITYRRLNIEAENDDELINIQKDIEKKFDEFVKETKNKKDKRKIEG